MCRGRPAIAQVLIAALAVALSAACGAEHTVAHRAEDTLAAGSTISEAAAEAAEPVLLTVATAEAPITAISTDADGVLAPPEDIARLGWWADSALPGSGSGVIVITGHVDDAERGAGFAATFLTLTPGDRVALRTTGGSLLTYRVTRTEQPGKNAPGALDELNRLDGPETLALVTCGGEFIGPPLGYQDNVLVFAQPDQ